MIFRRHYFRMQLIAAFCIISLLLVWVTSWVSYRFIRNLYLEEMSDQISVLSSVYSSRIDNDFLTFLELGKPSATAEKYFKSLFLPAEAKSVMEAFVFDNEFRIVLHSFKNDQYEMNEPDLLLHRKELQALPIRKSFTSIPFRGDDGQWYLWGFTRLNGNFCLAIKENALRLQKVEDFAYVFWLIGLGGGILALLLSVYIAKSITKPIDKLVAFSSEIGAANFSVTQPDGIKGELSILSDAMDKMKLDLSGQQEEKEQLLAQIAHEIRNPLGGIELLTNLVREGPAGNGKDAQHLDRIIAEIAGLKELITNYLNFQKARKTAPSWVELEPVISSVTAMCEPELRKKRCLLSTKIDLKKVYFDTEHLKQILLNLITNSIHSVPDGGSISLRTFTENNSWCISISDDGAGLNNDELKKIFTPFFTTKKDGTGLGLAICLKLARENRADLAAKNNVSAGCTFTLKKEISNEA